jgi:hypothetical protein
MFVELQHPSAHEAMVRDHAWMTVEALVRVFCWSRPKAQGAVAALWKRYDAVPAATRDRLVHEDPVNLAAELAEVAQTALAEGPYQERLQQYNLEVRKIAENIRSAADQPAAVRALA